MKRFVEELKSQLFGEHGQLNSMGMNLSDAMRFAEFLASVSPTRKEIEEYVRQQYHSVSQARTPDMGS